MKIQGKAVLILPDNPPEKTKGNLFIPRSYSEQPQEGKVVACGPECESVHVGDRVNFSFKYSSLIKIDEVLHCFTYEEPDKIFYIYD